MARRDPLATRARSREFLVPSRATSSAGAEDDGKHDDKIESCLGNTPIARGVGLGAELREIDAVNAIDGLVGVGACPGPDDVRQP